MAVRLQQYQGQRAEHQRLADALLHKAQVGVRRALLEALRAVKSKAAGSELCPLFSSCVLRSFLRLEALLRDLARRITVLPRFEVRKLPRAKATMRRSARSSSSKIIDGNL